MKARGARRKALRYLRSPEVRGHWRDDDPGGSAARIERIRGAVREAGPKGISVPVPWLVGLAVAAGILACVWILGRAADRGGAGDGLVAWATDLAESDPDLFAGFSPLDREVLRSSPAPSILRAGAPGLFPGGDALVASRRPRFHWAGLGPVSGVRLALFSEEGERVWTTDANASPTGYPPEQGELERGRRYFWSLEYEDALGARQEAVSTVFEVASPSAVASLTRGLEVIEARVAADTVDLLAAHWALRRGFLGVAAAKAREHLARWPDDPVGRETLDHVLRRTGVDSVGTGPDERITKD